MRGHHHTREGQGGRLRARETRGVGTLIFFLQQEASHGLNATQNPAQPVRWQQSDRFSQPKAADRSPPRERVFMPQTGH